MTQANRCAPRAGVESETSQSAFISALLWVAPRAGAWIETAAVRDRLAPALLAWPE